MQQEMIEAERIEATLVRLRTHPTNKDTIRELEHIRLSCLTNAMRCRWIRQKMHEEGITEEQAYIKSATYDAHRKATSMLRKHPNLPALNYYVESHIQPNEWREWQERMQRLTPGWDIEASWFNLFTQASDALITVRARKVVDKTTNPTQQAILTGLIDSSIDLAAQEASQLQEAIRLSLLGPDAPSDTGDGGGDGPSHTGDPSDTGDGGGDAPSETGDGGGDGPSHTGDGGNWVQYVDPNSGNPYYYNTLTRETTWVRPTRYVDLHSAKEKALELEAALRRSLVEQ